MNILLINHYAGSKDYGMEYRPYYLAKEWVKRGHNVTIIGASYSHLRLKQPDVPKDYTQEEIEGIKYVWFKTPSYGGSLKRILNISTFLFKLKKYVKRISADFKPELVITSSTYPIDIYSAHAIAKRSNAKLAYEVHDLWPLSPMIIGGYSPNHPFIKVMQKGEDYACKHVDKIVSLLWNAEEHFKEHGLAKGKFFCVPNGYFPEDWTSEKLQLTLPDEHLEAFDKLRGKIIVGFAGGFAASGALMTLLETAKILKQDEDIHFVLVGNGPEKESLEEFALNNSLQNVTFLPSIKKQLIPKINSLFTMAYLGGVHSELHKYGTSYNKMTDYMLSAKPIVQAVDEPGSVIERVGCGIRVEAENPDQVANAIRKIAAMSDMERQEMGKRGREYSIQNLQWSNLAQKFLRPFIN